MYVDKRRSMKIKGEGFEGLIKADGYHIIGQLGGREFDAEIETSEGKRNLSVLVAELVNAELN